MDFTAFTASTETRSTGSTATNNRPVLAIRQSLKQEIQAAIWQSVIDTMVQTINSPMIQVNGEWYQADSDDLAQTFRTAYNDIRPEGPDRKMTKDGSYEALNKLRDYAESIADSDESESDAA